MIITERFGELYVYSQMYREQILQILSAEKDGTNEKRFVAFNNVGRNFNKILKKSTNRENMYVTANFNGRDHMEFAIV